MAESSKYPSYRWMLDGTLVVVNSIAEDDPNLLTHHPDDVEKGGTMSPPTRFKKADLVRLLTEGNVAFDPSSSVEDLRATLTLALTNAVQARNLDMPDGADAETLYAMLQV